MIVPPRRIAAFVALLATAAVRFATAQDAGAEDAQIPAAGEAPDEVIVRGNRSALRFALERAELAVYARFNEINSDDRFDIHCFSETRLGSHVKHRVCASNDWRDKSAAIAQSFLAQTRGEAAVPAQAINAEQLGVQRQLREEMVRLAHADPELAAAVKRLGAAQQAFTQQSARAGELSVSRTIEAGAEGLPFEADQMVEVRVGREPWDHALTHLTFTLGNVSGKVESFDARCDQGRRRFDYAADAEWTLPAGWTRCVLRVRAEPQTTFVLYEFAR